MNSAFLNLYQYTELMPLKFFLLRFYQSTFVKNDSYFHRSRIFLNLKVILILFSIFLKTSFENNGYLTLKLQFLNKLICPNSLIFRTVMSVGLKSCKTAYDFMG